MKVVDIFGQEERCESVAGEERVIGPLSNERCEGIQIVIEAWGWRGEEVGIFDDAPDLHCGLVQAGEICTIAEIARQVFDRRARRLPVFLAFLKSRPLGK